jgi:hypothetical protein
LHQLLDMRPWPLVVLRNPLLILTAVLVGALAAFAYSYAPLHRAKDWKIDYLEERLEGRRDQVREFEERLTSAHASLDGTPSDEEIRALRTRLEEETRLAASREKENKALDRKLESLTRSRDSWKSRHAAVAQDLEKQSQAAPAATTVNLAAEPKTEAREPESAPAAPSPTAAVAEPAASAAEAPASE